MSLPSRLGCSTISFQHLPLHEALEEISALGFSQIDLGALPGVCDHVPPQLDTRAIESVTATILASGLAVRSVNGDIGDFNRSDLSDAERSSRTAHLDLLLALTAAVGAQALVLPCGSLGQSPLTSIEADLDLVAASLLEADQRAHEHGVKIWVESLHFLRVCHNRERAELLHDRLKGSGVRLVLDFAHVVAAEEDLNGIIEAWAPEISHVHLRDATAGNFNVPFGTGDVNFASAIAALEHVGFTCAYTLEMPSAAYQENATGSLDADARSAKTKVVANASELILPMIPTEA